MPRLLGGTSLNRVKKLGDTPTATAVASRFQIALHCLVIIRVQKNKRTDTLIGFSWFSYQLTTHSNVLESRSTHLGRFVHVSKVHKYPTPHQSLQTRQIEPAVCIPLRH